MRGISTKVAGFGVTGSALGLLYWCLFTTTWWPTLSPAPPAEIWYQFSILVSAAVAYFIPELAAIEAAVVEEPPSDA